MAFTELTVQETLSSGTTVVYTAAAADGNSFGNEFGTRLYVVNGGIAPINVTIKSQVSCSHGFRHDQVVVIPDDGIPVEIGPFIPDRYLSRDGLVEATYSAVTDVTVAAARPSIH